MILFLKIERLTVSSVLNIRSNKIYYYCINELKYCIYSRTNKFSIIGKVKNCLKALILTESTK